MPAVDENSHDCNLEPAAAEQQRGQQKLHGARINQNACGQSPLYAKAGLLKQKTESDAQKNVSEQNGERSCKGETNRFLHDITALIQSNVGAGPRY